MQDCERVIVQVCLQLNCHSAVNIDENCIVRTGYSGTRQMCKDFSLLYEIKGKETIEKTHLTFILPLIWKIVHQFYSRGTRFSCINKETIKLTRTLNARMSQNGTQSTASDLFTRTISFHCPAFSRPAQSHITGVEFEFVAMQVVAWVVIRATKLKFVAESRTQVYLAFRSMLPQLTTLHFVARPAALAGGNTRNNGFKLAMQQCCETSWKKLLPVLSDLKEQRVRDCFLPAIIVHH